MSSYKKEFKLNGGESKDEYAAGDSLADNLSGDWVLIRDPEAGEQWLCTEVDDE